MSNFPISNFWLLIIGHWSLFDYWLLVIGDSFKGLEGKPPDPTKPETEGLLLEK